MHYVGPARPDYRAVRATRRLTPAEISGDLSST
jgi:hypothetical protein